MALFFFLGLIAGLIAGPVALCFLVQAFILLDRKRRNFFIAGVVPGVILMIAGWTTLIVLVFVKGRNKLQGDFDDAVQEIEDSLPPGFGTRLLYG